MSTLASRLVRWQVRHGRHDLPWQGTRDPYRIWLSEVMLQQTQVATVIPYYERFLARFPDVKSLAGAPLDDVLALWSGLGYYSRARNLHAAAQAVAESRGGRFPRTSKALASLPGVGRSTAAAIAVFAFGEREAILDGNVKRVLARHFAVRGYPGEKRVENRLWKIAESQLPGKDVERYTQALMDLGAGVCTRTRPACATCPLEASCEARAGEASAGRNMGRAVVSPGNFHGCRSARLLQTPIRREARQRTAPAASAARVHPFHPGYHAGRLPGGERIAVRLGARASLAPSRRSGPGGGTRAREETAQFSAGRLAAARPRLSRNRCRMESRARLSVSSSSFCLAARGTGRISVRRYPTHAASSKACGSAKMGLP